MTEHSAEIDAQICAECGHTTRDHVGRLLGHPLCIWCGCRNDPARVNSPEKTTRP